MYWGGAPRMDSNAKDWNWVLLCWVMRMMAPLTPAKSKLRYTLESKVSIPALRESVIVLEADVPTVAEKSRSWVASTVVVTVVVVVVVVLVVVVALLLLLS